VLLSLVAVVICNLCFGYYTRALETAAPGVGIPDALPLVGADKLYALLEQLGPAGREAYAPIAAIDMIYPIAYGSHCLLAIAWGLRDRIEQNVVFRWCVGLPVIVVLADYAENLSVHAMIEAWPGPSSAATAWAATGWAPTVWTYAHNLKWVAGIPCFLIAFAAAIRGLMRARRQKHPTTS